MLVVVAAPAGCARRQAGQGGKHPLECLLLEGQVLLFLQFSGTACHALQQPESGLLRQA